MLLMVRASVTDVSNVSEDDDADEAKVVVESLMNAAALERDVDTSWAHFVVQVHGKVGDKIHGLVGFPHSLQTPSENSTGVFKSAKLPYAPGDE